VKVETGYYGTLTRLEAFAAEISVFPPASGSSGLFFALRFEKDSEEKPVRFHEVYHEKG